MKLTDICWPVYKLGRVSPFCEDGVSLILYRNEYKVIDDTHYPGDSLAIRRLHMLSEGIKLYPLRIAYFFPGDLIKAADPKLYFIDSAGKIFKYIKSRTVPLIFSPISTVKVSGSGVIIEAKHVPGRHKALYPPIEGQKYAGFLKIGFKTYILYGFFEEMHKDTIRKI